MAADCGSPWATKNIKPSCHLRIFKSWNHESPGPETKPPTTPGTVKEKHPKPHGQGKNYAGTTLSIWMYSFSFSMKSLGDLRTHWYISPFLSFFDLSSVCNSLPALARQIPPSSHSWDYHQLSSNSSFVSALSRSSNRFNPLMSMFLPSAITSTRLRITEKPNAGPLNKSPNPWQTSSMISIQVNWILEFLPSNFGSSKPSKCGIVAGFAGGFEAWWCRHGTRSLCAIMPSSQPHVQSLHIGVCNGNEMEKNKRPFGLFCWCTTFFGKERKPPETSSNGWNPTL